jgi:multicomponent Na+:H+ antiporter subunit A
MLGIGGTAGAVGASFYVIAHALAKSALFLTAGVVTEATGKKGLHELGGLWRAMPLLAAGSGAAAAGLAALPLTAGFFKDELFFHAARERGDIVTALAVGGAILTFAYMGRFWGGIFVGSMPAPAGPVPRRLVWSVAALGGLVIAGGIWPEPITRLAEAAAEATVWEIVEANPAYHVDTRTENMMAVAAWAGGLILLLAQPVWRRATQALAHLGETAGPERLYGLGLKGLNLASDRIHQFEVHDLRGRVATILLPTGVLVLIGFLATPTRGAFTSGSIHRDNLPELLMLGVAALAAVTAAYPRDHLSLSLVLSGVGFSLAVVYAFLGAPNVTLVAVLIETIFSLLFLGMLALMPQDVDHDTVRRGDVTGVPPDRSMRWRDPALAVIAGGVAFLVAWSALSKPVALESVTADLTELTPEAHGKNIVTVVLADFRGFDTMGEITVIGIAFLGLATLLRRWRAR